MKGSKTSTSSLLPQGGPKRLLTVVSAACLGLAVLSVLVGHIQAGSPPESVTAARIYRASINAHNAVTLASHTATQTVASGLARDSGRARAAAVRRQSVLNRLRELAAIFSGGRDDERRLLAAHIKTEYTPELLNEVLAESVHGSDESSGLVRGSFVVNGHRSRYLARVPLEYTADHPWPVHIALHGGGGSSIRTCEVNWQGEPAKHGVILVCPTYDNALWWTKGGEATILAAVEHIRERYNVDPEQISIGGASSGGFGAWHMATKYPWLWSAVTPRCAATPRNPDTLLNLVNLPVYMLHGDRDGTINIFNSERSNAILTDAGYDVTYLPQPGYGHSFMRNKNVEVVDWLKAHRRNPQPAEFTYEVTRRGPPPARIHWLRFDWAGKIRKGTTVSASITRASSRDESNVVDVVVDSPIDGFTLLLQPHLFNAAAPLLVRFGGETVYSGPVEHSTDLLLASWRDHRDAGLLSADGVHIELRADQDLPASAARTERDVALGLERKGIILN